MIVQPLTRRRWLPLFSLRAIIVLLVLVCFVLAAGRLWFLSQEAEHRRQLSIAAQLQQWDAGVGWEQQAPAWLGWATSWDICQRIYYISCYKNPNFEKILGVLPELQTVSKLEHVSHAELNDEIIDRLRQSRHVKHLGIEIALDDQHNREWVTQYLRDLRRRLPDLEIAGYVLIDGEFAYFLPSGKQ